MGVLRELWYRCRGDFSGAKMSAGQCGYPQRLRRQRERIRAYIMALRAATTGQESCTGVRPAVAVPDLFLIMRVSSHAFSTMVTQFIAEELGAAGFDRTAAALLPSMPWTSRWIA